MGEMTLVLESISFEAMYEWQFKTQCLGNTAIFGLLDNVIHKWLKLVYMYYQTLQFCNINLCQACKLSQLKILVAKCGKAQHVYVLEYVQILVECLGITLIRFNDKKLLFVQIKDLEPCHFRP